MKLTEFIEKLQEYKKQKLSYEWDEVDFVLETKPNSSETGDYEPLNISGYFVNRPIGCCCDPFGRAPSTLTIGFINTIEENENA